MNRGIFHIFRNTPLGRETIFQSMYFARTLQIPLRVYIAQTTRFLMYFDQAVVQIDLDPSYLRSPETARRHLDALVQESAVSAEMVAPRHFTGPGLPDIPTEFDFMSCPRCISHPSSRIGLGVIGPKVRMLVTKARFPVLITSPVFKPWRSLAVLCSGDAAHDRALDAAMILKARTGMALDYYRLGSGSVQSAPPPVADAARHCRALEMTSLAEALYGIPHDALVIIGTGSQVLLKSLLFGSLLEKVQATLANNLLVVGPNAAAASVWPAAARQAHSAPLEIPPECAAAWR